MPRTFLLSAPSEGSHLAAILPLARELAARGHRALVAGPASIAAPVAKAGAVHVETPPFDVFARLGARARQAPHPPRPPGPAWLPEHLRLQLGRVRGLLAFRTLLEDVTESTAKILEDVIARERPDALLVESVLFGARYAAERAGIPFLTIGSDPTLALDERGVNALPPRPGMRRIPRAPWILAVDRAFPLGRVRRRLGLPAQQRTAELYDLLVSERLHLVPSFPEMHRSAPRAGHVYIGPFADDAAPGAAPVEDLPEGMILLAWSTLRRPDAAALFRRTVTALGATGRPVVVTGGAATFEGALPRTTRLVKGFAPHATMVPAARALVTHGGWGVVSRGLRAGVPMLVTSVFGPQPMIGQRLAELGLARTMPASEVDPASIARELDALLADEGLRERLARFRERLAATDASIVAVDAIEKVVG